jgi:hypothetical protein
MAGHLAQHAAIPPAGAAEFPSSSAAPAIVQTTIDTDHRPMTHTNCLSKNPADLAILRAAKLRIAQRMTSSGYDVAERAIDLQVALQRGLSLFQARKMRCSREMAAIEAKIARLSDGGAA